MDIVPKILNPPNVPELRSIERFWAHMKNLLRKEGKKAKTIEEVQNIWISTSRKLKEDNIKNLMAHVKHWLRLFKNKKIN